MIQSAVSGTTTIILLRFFYSCPFPSDDSPHSSPPVIVFRSPDTAAYLQACRKVAIRFLGEKILLLQIAGISCYKIGTGANQHANGVFWSRKFTEALGWQKSPGHDETYGPLGELPLQREYEAHFSAIPCLVFYEEDKICREVNRPASTCAKWLFCAKL
jgi:hypothetical protein